jgi:hypothetical protein
MAMSKTAVTPPKANVEQLYQRISAVLADARSSAYRAVNFAMVQAYWEIGRIIVEEEQQRKATAQYGSRLIIELLKRLKVGFGKGFDRSNLWIMRSFYLAFPILDALRRELTWTHYRLLLKVERPEVRQFYLDECIAANWSTRQLDRQIATVANAEQTLLYWRIGKRVADENLVDGRAEYGKQIVVTVSRQLEAEFGKGFSYSSLTRMVRFSEL